MWAVKVCDTEVDFCHFLQCPLKTLIYIQMTVLGSVEETHSNCSTASIGTGNQAALRCCQGNLELPSIQVQWSSHTHRYWHIANHILTAGTHDLTTKKKTQHMLYRQLTEHLVGCLYVHVHLRVVVVCVWQGGESCGKGKLCRYHLSAYGHSSLRSLHQSLQFVRRNVFGIDQQHHLGITQETGPELQETDCLFIR